MIKENELKDICDNAFKRNSIYPLMEIPKADSKDTIEEQYKQAEIFPVWNDIDRIDASKIWKYKNENTENKENKKYIKIMGKGIDKLLEKHINKSKS